MQHALIGCTLIIAVATFDGRAEAAVIQGRVVDSTGKPISGAEVKIELPALGGQGISGQQVSFDGREVLGTDEAGRFVTPDLVTEQPFARIIVDAPAMFAGRSGWIEVSKEATVTAPDIVLKRPTAVLGKVTDRDGRPVAGVSVFNSGDGHQRVEATTGQSGKFFLDGVPEGAVFLFAEKAGYRFTGIHLPADKRDAAFELATVNEPAEPVATLSPLVSDEERTGLARKVLDRRLEKATKSEAVGSWEIRALANLDPLEASNRVRKMQLGPPRTRRFLELIILTNCIERRDLFSWDELRTVIDSTEDPSWRTQAYVWVVRQMGQAEGPRRRQWLAEGLTHARRIGEPAQRAQSLVVVATGLFDCEDDEQGKEVISEAEKLAEPLAAWDQESQRTFRTLALNLAKRDPVRALVWLERINSDYAYVHDGGDLAVKLLPEHPATAEETWRRTVERLDGDSSKCHMGERGIQLANLCYRLAGVDRLRAEQIARDTRAQPLRVRGLGAVALQLADSDPAAARQLLDSIIRQELPRPMVDDDFEPFGFSGLAPPLTAAWILPIAERIDPQLGRECFWRSLALRAHRPRRGRLDDKDAEIDIDLAMMLSRYDRDVARALLEPLVARLPEFARPTTTELKLPAALAIARNCRSLERTLISAAAQIDPSWAAELFDNRFPYDTPSLGHFDVAEALVDTLSHTGANRWGEDGFFSAFSANYWQPTDR